VYIGFAYAYAYALDKDVGNKPVPAGKRKLESGHFSQMQVHLAREPRTPVDRGNRLFFSPGTGL
jgi:hypothetical protein